MFERYTEQARRTLFWARFEASRFGSPYVETEYLLLGMLRHETILKNRLPPTAVEEIRREIERSAAQREGGSTASVDLPLSADCKRALSFAAEEATALGDLHIDIGHLVLGLLREETCKAALILRRHRVDLVSFRDTVRTSRSDVRAAIQIQFQHPQRIQEDYVETPEIAAPSLEKSVTALSILIERMGGNLEIYSEEYGSARLKRKPWSRKQAVGHLLDWATTHHQWFVRAIVESKLVASGYPQEEWVAVQQYHELRWTAIVDAWISLNRHLLAMLARVPEQKTSTPCRIGLADAISFADLVTAYVAHCEDLAGQILAKLT